MRPLNPTQSESPQSGFIRVFCGPEEDFAVESRRIVILVDAWLKSMSGPRPDFRAASLVERKLHDAIKSSPLYGKVLSFAGLNLWVDERTAAGQVEFQESISL